MKVQMVMHFGVEDKDCGGEYFEVTVVVDDTVVITYGDDYHEKGEDKALGFIDALRHTAGEENVEVLPTKLIADWAY